MNETSRPAEPTEILAKEDYDAIENAVMETARGRWFLAEYARRHRAADTTMLLDAIKRLEITIQDQTPALAATDLPALAEVDAPADEASEPVPHQKPAMERLLLDVAELSAAIQLTRQEIVELGLKQESEGGFEQASDELDEIVSHTEQATGEILNAAEAIQEAIWKLREQGADEAICDQIDSGAIDIYTACSFQDITGQRISKVVSLMGFTEKHVQRMMGIWSGQAETSSDRDETAEAPDADRDVVGGDVVGGDDALLNGPALDGAGLDQSDIDSMLAGGPFAGQDTFAPVEDTSAQAEAVVGQEPDVIGEPGAMSGTGDNVPEEAIGLPDDDVAPALKLAADQ